MDVDWRKRRAVMRSWLTALVVTLFATGATGCGGTSRSSAPSARGARSATARATAATRGYVRGDGDVGGDDGPNGDDHGVREYGREGTAAERRAVTAVVKRYYAAAAARDAVEVCALIYSKIADSSNFNAVVPEEYRAAPGSSIFRGKRCAQVEALLLEPDHQQLVAESATVQVTSVRVAGAHGLALLGFRSIAERMIPMQREGSTWKIDALLDSEVP